MIFVPRGAAGDLRGKSYASLMGVEGYYKQPQ